MSTGLTKSRSPVERSYSSASSTTSRTSSRRSGRRKRRRMKHTVMPLKKRPGRHEVPCDVHRVSNLDHEEMEQSACFWVAKNANDPAERSFKEEVFVNKDQDSSDEEASFLEETRQSQTTDELTHELRTDSRTDAYYANEDEKNDANYSEEKTFYGVRKGQVLDGNEVERVSPLPSPRNRSRMSSISDEGGFSSEGTGMHVGWTSDVGVSSEPEYSGMTDSDGEGGHKRTSKEFYGYREKQGEKPQSEFPTRKIRERNNNESGFVTATDITTTETTDITTTQTTEVQNFERDEMKNGFERDHQENGIDREFYTKEEMESSHSAYNGGHIYHGDFEPRDSDPRYYETSEGVPLFGEKTSTPAGHVYPSSDTELVNFREFDIEVDRFSDRSLPLGGHKTKTQYYSVEDLLREAQEQASVEKADSGSDGPEVPRGYGEYEKYEPPRDELPREESPAIQEPHEESQPNGGDEESPKVAPSPYVQRPLLVPRREKEKLAAPDDRPEIDDEEGTFEDSKEFYGYRRANTGDEYTSENKENVSPQYNQEQDSGPSTTENVRENYQRTGTSRDEREVPRDGRILSEDDRRFEENKEFYGYRHSRTGTEPRDDVDTRQRYEENRVSGDQSKKWEETKEFYGYKTSTTGNQSGRKEGPRYDHEKVSGQPTKQKAWEQNQEFYGFQQSRAGNEFDNVSPQDARQQPSGTTRKTQTWQESREYYGYRSKTTGDRSSEKIPKDSREGYDGEVWEESKEFFGFRRRQVVDGHSHFADSGYQERPRSPLQRRLEPIDNKPRYPDSADDRFRQPNVERMTDGVAREKPGEEPITRSNEPENLMSVDEGRDFDEDNEDSKEFSGYRNGQPPIIPRSAAYEQYQRPDQSPRSAKEPPTRGESPGDRVTTRGYDVTTKTTRYTDRSSRETNVMKYKEQTSRQDMKDGPSKNEPTREYDPSGDYVSSDMPRDQHMFNLLEIPSSKKVIPLVSDVAPKVEKTTTETTSKRLHTRSQRDTLRREARQPESTVPESSDVGMKMFRERSLPRKHSYPTTSSDEKTKELPRKIKKSDEPDLSKCDPDFANKFREITDKRNKKTKSTTKTTVTTTRSAAESCNKNVEELVNVFDTLKHIQKSGDKKDDKNAPVKHGPAAGNLATPPAKDGKLSPSTSISQNLEEIESILDSVDKNSQRRARKKPDAENEPPPHQDHQTNRTDRNTRVVDTQKTTTTRTTRKARETREERETREKHAWKPDTSGDVITKQEAMSMESFLEDEPPRDQPAERGRPSGVPDPNRPWSYTNHSPYRTDKWPRGYDEARSRDDDDEIYLAQMRKSREERWNDRPSRKKKYESKSDGEIEGFSRPFGDRVITPGTPVNIRLYGLNLRKTEQERADGLDWELFPGSQVPVDESFGRTQVKKQPLAVHEMPGYKPPTEEPAIDRTHVMRDFDINFQFKEGEDETRMRDQSMREQHEPLYRRQERLPRKRDAPIARSDSWDDDKVTSQEIKWSHPPVSIARPEKEPPSKVRRDESRDTQEVMEVDSVTKTTTEITRKPVKTPSKKIPSEKQPQEELPFEVYPSEEQPLEDLPMEERPWKRPPSDKRPTGKRPSQERPQDIEIPVEKDQENEVNQEPDERVIEIEYTDEDEDQNILPEDSTLPENMQPDNFLRSSTPKERPRSPRLSDDIFDEDTSERTHEEHSSSEKHESTKHVDHTIHTTRTTRTTRTETTTETSVKKVRKSGSESSRPATARSPANDEPEYIIPVWNKPEYSATDSSRPDVKPARNEPEYFTPAEEPEYITPVYSQPEYAEPESSKTEADGGDGEPRSGDGEPRSGVGEPRSADEPSLVAHEYIMMNADTCGPINLTVLGRVEENEDDDDYLSSQSREDLFLHTRLKMVTENKQMRRKQRPEDAHLLEPQPADQDDVDNEGELTDSDDEFDADSRQVPVVPDGDITEQILIPISGKIDESIARKDKLTYVLPEDDTTDIFRSRVLVDEPVSKTDQPTRETITRDSLGNVLAPRIPHEPGIEKEIAPDKDFPEFESIPGFEEPISENVESSTRPDKPDAFLEFGEPVEDKEVQRDTPKDIEVVLLPVFEDFTAESAPTADLNIPPEKTPVDEEISKERMATPTLPEFQSKPVDENITSEKQDTPLVIPVILDIPESKPPELVDETINPCAHSPREIYIPDLEEVLPEMRRPPTPDLVDETFTSEERHIEIELPHFPEPRPSQPIDEDMILSEPIKKQDYVPDFAELMPELKKPVNLVDENVTSERREMELDLPEFQDPEPERRASEPITEQISAEEPISSDVYIPDFSEIEFQEVVPEFPESCTINEDRDIPIEEEPKNIELPGFQKAVQEPVRNLAITDSDLEVEAPSSSGSPSLSTESEHSIPIDKNDGARPEDETADKDTPEKDTREDTPKKDPTIPEDDTPEDEAWSETCVENRTFKETRTTETVTIEETITKYVPQKKDESVSPKSPKAVHFATSIEPKESSGSSSEPSPRSSSGADVSDRSTDVTPEVLDTDKPDGPARRRRNRRGNRFDNIKRSGPLVPESVIRDESPGSNTRQSYVPRVGYSGDMFLMDSERVVPEREKLVSNVPDSVSPIFTPRAKTGQLRPEMYLLDSDDENQGGDLDIDDEAPEVVAVELCVPQERADSEEIPGEDEIPERDELSPELIDELLEKEVLGLPKDDESLSPSEDDQRAEIVEEISKEDKMPEDVENVPEDEPQTETIDQIVLAEAERLTDDILREVTEEIDKPLEVDRPGLPEEEDDGLPEEKVEDAIEQEQSSSSEEELETLTEDMPKGIDEQVLADEIWPDIDQVEEELELDEPPEKSGVSIPIEVVGNDDDVSDDDVNDDDVSDDDVNDDDGDKDDDVEDDVMVKQDEDVTRPEGVTTTGGSTIETVIIEKTHSEVSTTVTEITTTRHPSQPSSSPDIPESHKVPSSDDEDELTKIPIVAEPDEVVKPSEVEAVEAALDDEPTTYDEQPATPDDHSIPLLIVTKGTTSESESDKESSSSDSSTTESDDERTDESIGKVVSTKVMAEPSGPATETVLGIVDIKYEKSQSEDLFILETSTLSSADVREKTEISEKDSESSDEDSQKEVPVILVLEETPTSKDVSADDDVPTVTKQAPEEDTAPLEFEIAVVPVDEPSTSSSSGDESTSEDEGVPRGVTDTTVETIIVEKTSTQISTTITEITPKNVPCYPISDAHVLPFTTEDVPIPVEECPSPKEYIPMAEDVPRTDEVPMYESAPISDDELVFDISPEVQIETTDGLGPIAHDVTEIQTSERESQTDHRDMYSETTQTEDTSEMARKPSGTTRDAYSMTVTKSSSDSEMQTQIPLDSASTQTDSDSQWYQYTRTVQEFRESSEKVTTMPRQCSDGETQTDIPVDDSETQTHAHVTSECSSMTDDDLRVVATTHEGTQTEEGGEGGYFSESEVTRVTRTETRTEKSYKEETETFSPSRDDMKSDCPVCLQSLEATNYSFIKIKDLSRFAAMEEKSSQYEMQETAHSFCFACGRDGNTRDLRESSEYSSTTRDERGQVLRQEHRESGGYSSTFRDEWEQEDFTTEQRESEGYSSTREEWRREGTTQEASGYSRTTREEWEQDVVIQSESSTEVSGEAHFSIRIDGDEKCSLYCRRSGQHACALQKLASIIQAHRNAAASSETDRPQAHPETVATTESEETEHEETGTTDVIGQERCDVGVQTDGALLPADFEVFSDKDFEIYYDEQKSPYWFV